MKKKVRNFVVSSLLASFFFLRLSAAKADIPEDKCWNPQPDAVYLQETADRIMTGQPVTGIGTDGTSCYAILGGSLYIIDGSSLKEEKGSPDGVRRLVSAGGSLWALATGGVYRHLSGMWQKTDNREFVDLCVHNGIVHGATRDDILKLENGRFVSVKPAGGYNSSDVTVMMEDGTQVHAEPVRPGPILRIASHTGCLYILEPGRLVQFDGLMLNRDFIDWGTLPSKQTKDMINAGSRLFVATEKGLAFLRGASLSSVRGVNGLPVENTTCLTQGFEDDLWIGTTRGAVRMLRSGWQYFGKDLWLPGDHVNAIATGDKTVCIATDKGITRLRYEPYTLLKKASFFERHMEEWGHKRLGFIHMLSRKGDKWIRKISDNDGGNTATYLAAMCYKYAVTKDETAGKEAVESFKAMMWLERITGTDGFFARAIWSPEGDDDEMDKEGSGGLPAKWYRTKDGKWYWKGDTSSDEVTSHFYAVSLFYDLVAEGKDKEAAGKHLERIASFILKNGWMLKDMDGKPTRWGHWEPEYLLRPYGYTDRGLNGLEALNFMETAFHVTGDNKFIKGKDVLISWGYDENTIRQKNVFPPEAIAPWDDNLAFESYNTILRYATDPGLRSILLRSLERTWEIKRIDHNPWYNFTYGLFTGNDCEPDQAVKYLKDYRLDCTEYNFSNSERDDLYPEPGYTSYEGSPRTFSPGESGAPSQSDGGHNGLTVKEPTDFLRDYWMARYYGFILPPVVSDPDLTSVKPGTYGNQGANPYTGPLRPVLY